MSLTPYHAKLLAHDLTLRQPADELKKFTASLQDAQVDLNPHQVDAALFAFKSPLSKGAILADEVGLGKTIEAGIILSQKWAERKQKLLIIAPSNLRKQWNQELWDKFFLPSVILETKSFNQAIKLDKPNPFLQEEPAIVICSYQFARNKEYYLRRVEWDLVVIDEAHRLRNVYKPTNKIGNSIKSSLEQRKKVLLTATPLQNSILELYGLVSIIDEYAFGDLKSFKSQFSRLVEKDNFSTLRARLKPLCHRTLRRQVSPYINFTARRAIVERFEPSKPEQDLYEGVSAYLQRDNLFALPVGQRQLVTLILRKLLASSSFAIAATFDTLIKRLEKLAGVKAIEDSLAEDFEAFDELKDEWADEGEESEYEPEALSPIVIEAIKKEIAELKVFRDLANSITSNTKAHRLDTALKAGFDMLKEIGANQKALIFTESRRTQEFLYRLLNVPGSGYEGKVMLFSGTNNDPLSARIYSDWLKKHKDTDRITGSPTADKRAALVDYFRDEATIMIATEAAAEGINLQFCSLVVNYDLPWNPQRIEQRIGRCHRYGQKHDVVVVNFLNTNNAADQRVYELLDKKFKLFDGVFGSSDEVLGAIGNGVDFEKRIARIYNECRDPASIQRAFDELQEDLKEDISGRMDDAKQKLLENVDDEVRNKLKIDFEKTKGYINMFQQKLWRLTRYFLQDCASFSNEEYSFSLDKNPFPGENIHPGPYMVLSPKENEKKSDIVVPDDTNVYRVGHPLAQRILNACKTKNTPTVELIFNKTATDRQVAARLDDYVGRSGWMDVSVLTLKSFDDYEDYLIIANYTADGEVIDAELSQNFFSLLATEGSLVDAPAEISESLTEIAKREKEEKLEENAKQNRIYFDTEIDKLDSWADDMKIGLQREIEDLDAEIKLRKAEARKMLSLEAKVKAQRSIKDLEKSRSEKRRSLYEAQDEIDSRKETLLDTVQRKLKQQPSTQPLFTVNWKMI